MTDSSSSDLKSGVAVPSRSERKICHAKRDAYFKCLDDNGIDIPAKRGSFCEDLRKSMFDGCPEVWANYFEQLRTMNKQKELAYKRSQAIK
ncbi:cytochrome oxidase c subunit VIb-domain-containing protein [Kickxella alabastrina]|uniref:cytochrome oxidase c subunit VIb-domain-containing protein n=1 Tax=Kickxella alabastrina TaxID=61397 RepID=UPI00222129EB|nr:cytochrome oxidase c subunit VIb-domain-containing protein [Kickxella alabastrina]KAI7821844.1 cytochrome oxidase c subunit VIb-domain-containing protein [Kickxella alabastrina]